MKIYNYLLVSLLVLSAMFAAGCVSKNEKTKNESLKIGLMPAVDSAPMLLAEKKGYFRDLGLDVELEIFTNAQDRQSALQTGAIDGAMTDLIAVAANVEGGFDIRATMMTNGIFPVLVKKGNAEKKTIKVGMMEVSVSNFLIDEWLGDRYTIEKVFINEIPARLAAIGSGQLDMGLFPEPVASMGVLNGLEKKLYKPEAGYCPDVMVFTGKALREKIKSIRLFHQAYNKAVEALAANSEEALNVLMERIPNLKPEVRNLIVLPAYTRASLPDDAYINKIITWTSGALRKEMHVSADKLVERQFVE